RVPRRRGGFRQVLFERLQRPGEMTRGRTGDGRRSILNRTGIAVDHYFDQRRGLMEILIWLAARFVSELRNDELMDGITLRHRYPHHDATVRTEHGNLLGHRQEVLQMR